MPCYHPISAFQCASGEIVFAERKRSDVVRSLQLPCGRCIGCRLERSRQWAVRCMHEAQMHDDSCVVTLTYSPEYLPASGSLEYDHFQRFMKRLRKRFGRPGVRFYMCGEYGEKEFRPHFHACLFGVDFPDKEFFKKSKVGDNLYTSKLLDSLWPMGHCLVGNLTFESAAYIARYCTVVQTGEQAKEYYRRIVPGTGEVVQLRPEFNKMSLKPGIGAAWFKAYARDVYPHDYVVSRGVEAKPPRFYDSMYERQFPQEFEELKFRRETAAAARSADATPERLFVKERVANARATAFKRDL